jgi:hypothetical protein
LNIIFELEYSGLKQTKTNPKDYLCHEDDHNPEI